MGRFQACCSQKTSLIIMMLMTSSFFLVEIIVGYISNSMALVADSFHMLSDVLSLVVGYFALKISQQASDKMDRNTFGWARAEVLGALVNSVFLVALCFSILVEAMKRLVQPEGIEDPIMVLIVGGAGLLVNLVGMCIFQGHVGHGHSHGNKGHGHSHGVSHHHDKPQENITPSIILPEGHPNPDNSSGGDIVVNPGAVDTSSKCHEDDWEDENDHDLPIENTLSPGKPKEDTVSVSSLQVMNLPFKGPLNTSDNVYNSNLGGPSRYSFRIIISTTNDSETTKHNASGATVESVKHVKADQMNMKAVYLHVLGDALGSIIVIVSVLIIYFVKATWTQYVDPVMSIIMVGIIMKSSGPLLKDSAMILLQTVPTHIQLNDMKKRLLGKFPAIMEVHEFHVWQLAGSKIIASLHIKFYTPEEYIRVCENIKVFFHNEGIHSTTIQPEFLEEGDTLKENGDCLMKCVSRSCVDSTCCTSVGLIRRTQSTAQRERTN